MTSPSMYRAAIVESPKRVGLAHVAVKEPGANEVRVKLEGCGVCASNLPVWEGRPWFNYPLNAGEPGHEGWGVVEQTGDGVDNVHLGDRVAFLSTRAYAECDVAKSDSLVVLPKELAGRFPGEAIG